MTEEVRGAESERWSGCTTAEDLYLELLKRCLTGLAFSDPGRSPRGGRQPRYGRLRRLFSRRKHRTVSAADVPFDRARRAIGRDWPTNAETMIGLDRLDNLHECMGRVISDDVPGDVIETGVWRGGATIFMRALLKVAGDTTRRVWVADSFSGLPPPEPEKYPLDAGDTHSQYEELAISLEAVKANFSRYGLLDDQVKFLAGWFADTLPTAPIERLAVLRLDGDMYASTYQALDALYPRLSVGGYLLVDDYALGGCRSAVDDFRRTHDITEPIEEVDWTGVYWRRDR